MTAADPTWVRVASNRGRFLREQGLPVERIGEGRWSGDYWVPPWAADLDALYCDLAASSAVLIDGQQVAFDWLAVFARAAADPTWAAAVASVWRMAARDQGVEAAYRAMRDLLPLLALRAMPRGARQPVLTAKAGVVQLIATGPTAHDPEDPPVANPYRRRPRPCR